MSLLTYTLKTLNVKGTTLPGLQSIARLSPDELYLYFPHAYTLWPGPVTFYISLVEPATGIFTDVFPCKWGLLPLPVGFLLCIHIIAQLLHVQ